MRLDHRRLARLLLVALVTGVAAAALGAQHVYRYQSDDGSYVYTTELPADAVRRGYTVLNRDGQVVKRVEGELTPEQRARRQAELEAERQRQARRRRDRELLRMYSSPEDVERAMRRRLATIQDAIATAQASIERVEMQKRSLEERAAQLERSGREVPRKLIARIAALEDDLGERRREVEARRRELDATRKRYHRDKARVRTLLAGGGR